ncbi:MAG: hypothetical protein J6B51_09990 [Clostridia bacterium]|nr:hypothetical protein [Clostridia bacterium]MBO5300385.1 hypothetical protein [Clostridia bacterium]
MTTTEILRIKTARDTIRAKLVALGLAESSEKIDSLATIVDDIPDNGAVSATVKEGETYSIPRGYHNGSGTVSGLSGGGNYNLQSKTVTPTKKQQSVTPDSGYFGLSDVTVNAIPSAYQDVSSVTAAAADVLANKIFVTASGAVTAGTMINNGTVNASIDGLTVTSYSIPAGYTSGGTVSLTNDIEQALAAI